MIFGKLAQYFLAAPQYFGEAPKLPQYSLEATMICGRLQQYFLKLPQYFLEASQYFGRATMIC